MTKGRIFFQALFAIAIMHLLGGCNQEKQMAPQERTSLRMAQLNPGRAVKDACNAIRLSDFRVIALRGYGIWYPGVPKEEKNIKARYGIIIVSDTSDSSSGFWESYQNKQAVEYAKRYNRKILSKSTCE